MTDPQPLPGVAPQPLPGHEEAHEPSAPHPAAAALHVSPLVASLIVKNQALWEKAHILPERQKEVAKVAARLTAINAKARYEEIEKATGVPWFIVAVIHEREASQDFTKQLGQGDPLNAPSRHVPRGRGPFFNHPNDPPLQDAFYRGAVDALENCPPYAARWTDWSAGGALTLLELYNGLGYDEFHHENTPYDWGATDQEQRGKYTGDGQFSSAAWDTQVGCAAMLMAMTEIDASITLPPRPTPPAAA